MSNTYRIDLPWDRPPLHANQRQHWARLANTTKAVRELAGWRVQGAINHGDLPRRAEHITVSLHWAPGDRRRRDGGENLAPLLKALIDGITDTRLVPDDTPEYVTRHMPAIHPPPAERGMWLEITTKETPR